MKKAPSPGLYTRQENGRLVDPDIDPVADALRSERREILLGVLDKLDGIHGRAMKLIYGLEDGIEHTLAEAGVILGVSGKRVGQIRNFVLRTLRSSSLGWELETFVVDGSSEVMETSQIDIGFSGLPPALQRDYEALLAGGADLDFDGPHEEQYDSFHTLEPIAALPLAASSPTSRLRMSRLPFHEKLLFHRLQRHTPQPLVFEVRSFDKRAIESLRKVMSHLIAKHCFRLLSERSSHSLQQYRAMFFYAIQRARLNGSSTCSLSRRQSKPILKTLQSTLSPFGITVKSEGSYLNFKTE